MTNEQRRLALAKARLKALEHAEAASAPHRSAGSDQDRDIRLAKMWAAVGGVMKVGSSVVGPDGVGPEPPDGEPFVNQPAYETR
jgi:hypothetical protein